MIVELRQPAADQLEYTTVATLTVYDDRSCSTSGAAELFDTGVPVHEPGRGRVSFTEDPAGWARNLPSLYRTGYLAAVVIEDAEAGATS